MTHIAILGSGKVATAIASKLASAGHRVIIGTREPRTTKEKWQGAAVCAGYPSQSRVGALRAFDRALGLSRS
jgi:8-hydroxy-5-deazaflavin:NADPH oxidoreductase